ncbi:hypothetical protein M404DRAFT_1002486 [Pisolithus tinctorius Marx 270]|uniref:Uncharacterized protein n=1 Tax=Pisolithus tinctorius Marx 270 TaxID=870435 RepID=A0A0C3J049_PISTI|nr:hypothetical protein M404DRAFT_1002486 [Pisolithus tinctorius Marx 270]
MHKRHDPCRGEYNRGLPLHQVRLIDYALATISMVTYICPSNTSEEQNLSLGLIECIR